MRLLKWPLNLKGKVFGHLVVVGGPIRKDPAYPHRISYECACCRCGYTSYITRSNLLHRGVKSCAKCARERAAETMRLRSRAAREAVEGGSAARDSAARDSAARDSDTCPSTVER